MAKLKLDTSFLEKILDQTTANDVGSFVKEQVIEMCARGVSPVMGEGKFQKYKDVSKYPGKKKSKSPVTLILSGKMLETISWKIAGVGKLLFGIPDAAKQEKYITSSGKQGGSVWDVALAHNFGIDPQPRRAFIPRMDKGETYNQTIMRRVIDKFNKRIQNLLK